MRVGLTAKGERCLTDLTPAHLAELRKLAAVLAELMTNWERRKRRAADAPRQESGRRRG